MIDPTRLRKTLGAFVTGVTVVTALDAQGEKRGFTANSFTSVSLDPPLILVCLAKKATSFPVFSQTGHFAVNILADAQRSVSSAFASKQPDKFANIASRPGTSGVPIIEGAAAWLECATHQRIDAGDHVILIGRVVDLGQSDRTPLGFYGGNYVNFGLEREAAEIGHDQPSLVGGVFEKDGKILLIKKGGQLGLPTGQTLGERVAEPGSLFDVLRKQGIDASVSFVFSIAHEDGSPRAGIYYRGEVRAGPPADSPTAVMVPFDAIPWEAIPSRNQQAMLQRYVKERAEARFGIYVGVAGGGTIKSLDPAS
jgi:flavin reductase (DIM6/NTAB) family NADH-FMN oxidoreductase RutF